jgi:hypothetical protein
MPVKCGHGMLWGIMQEDILWERDMMLRYYPACSFGTGK